MINVIDNNDQPLLLESVDNLEEAGATQSPIILAILNGVSRFVAGNTIISPYLHNRSYPTTAEQGPLLGRVNRAPSNLEP